MTDTKTPIVRSSSYIHPFKTKVAAFLLFVLCKQRLLTILVSTMDDMTDYDKRIKNRYPIALPFAHAYGVKSGLSDEQLYVLACPDSTSSL